MARKSLVSARMLTWPLLVLPLFGLPLHAFAEKPPAEGVRVMPPEAIESFNEGLERHYPDLDAPARLLKGYVPIYPVSRLLSRKEGNCNVAFTIGTDGRPARPEPDGKADPRMCDHALYALRYWEFEPGVRDGEPVEVRLRVPFQYGLDR